MASRILHSLKVSAIPKKVTHVEKKWKRSKCGKAWKMNLNNLANFLEMWLNELPYTWDYFHSKLWNNNYLQPQSLPFTNMSPIYSIPQASFQIVQLCNQQISCTQICLSQQTAELHAYNMPTQSKSVPWYSWAKGGPGRFEIHNGLWKAKTDTTCTSTWLNWRKGLKGLIFWVWAKV